MVVVLTWGSVVLLDKGSFIDLYCTIQGHENQMKIETAYYNLIPYENLLHVEAFLAWDDRVAIDLLKHVYQLKEKFYSDKSWALLADCRKWGLHTPEGERLISQVTIKKSEITLTHHAVVIGTSEIKKWQIGNIFSEENRISTEFFENIRDAKEWLASCGFDMTPIGDEV